MIKNENEGRERQGRKKRDGNEDSEEGESRGMEKRKSKVWS